MKKLLKKKLLKTSPLFVLLPVCLAAMLGACTSTEGPTATNTLVLEDFENTAAERQWEGVVKVVSGRATHGNRSGQVEFRSSSDAVSATHLPRDWSAYDRLLFDVASDREGFSTLTLRIYDELSGEVENAVQYDYFETRRNIAILKGWNHVEVKLRDARVSSHLRLLATDKITRLWLSSGRTQLPWTLHFDNFRLVRGTESAKTASRTEPQETVTLVDDRWFTVRQVADPEDVPESAHVGELRTRAEAERAKLENVIRAAQVQGIETIYQERLLVTAELGLRVRPLLPWFNNDSEKEKMFTYVHQSCREGRRVLEDLLRGVARLPHTDDTQVAESSVRPLPAKLKGSPMSGWFYRDEQGEPLYVLSLHSPSKNLERFFATPLQHIESYSVGGGSRWTVDESPVYEAFHTHPDTKRVGWDGWCGHLIRDLHSMGGTKKENVIICLESPHILRAIDEYIRINTPKFRENTQLLYDILAYELMYICYCDRSQQMFHTWLQQKYRSVARANAKWGTEYRSFSEVKGPPTKNARPLPDTNRALWYDWAKFNQDRFTDHLLWVRERVRRIDPNTPLAAGGSSYMTRGNTGISGIDEERIVNEVGDIIIHEGSGSTLGMDLQLAFANEPRPLADPEMNLRSVEYLLPHILHGKSVIQLFHWPQQPANEFQSLNRTSLAHSWNYSLEDIDELLRVSLDIRRLNKEIASFVEMPAEAAILYSQTATLQLPPEMLAWRSTPYLAELRKTYEAAQKQDARVTFITERQILKGRLDRYKLLLVPAARNLPGSVVESIWAYARQGGTVWITPESFLGDEYNSRQPYLSRLGVSVTGTQYPKAEAAGPLVQAYDQSLSAQVQFTDAGAEDLKPTDSLVAGTLRTEGIRQKITAGNGAETLYSYSDGKPAVVRVKLGQGTVYYSAASLEAEGYALLLDRLFEEAGIARPLRVRGVNGEPVRNVEARYAQLGERKLLYVANFNPGAVELKIEAADGLFEEVRELRLEKPVEDSRLRVPGRRTLIYELFSQTESVGPGATAGKN